MSEDNGSGKKIFYIILILLLLGINAFLIYKNRAEKKRFAAETAQLKGSLEAERDQVKVELNDAVQVIDQLKAENTGLTDQLTEIELKMDEQKTEINRLLSRKNVSRKELSEARKLIEVLRGTSESYRQQIETLQAENLRLRDTILYKETVTKKVYALKDSVESEYFTQQAEKESLEMDKAELEQTVATGSVLTAAGVKANGIRFKRNGKEITEDNYKKVEKVKVCFDIMENRIASSGPKDILLRIISPEGSTLAVESLGSGVFTHAKTGEERQYSTKATIDYNNTQDRYCMFWEQNFPFAEGTYNTEIYHEGYVIGKGDFSFKKGIF